MTFFTRFVFIVGLALIESVEAQTTLTNGANHVGTIAANGTNQYVFTAAAGDSILLRAGAMSLIPRLELFAPGNILIKSAFSPGTPDAFMVTQLTNSGEFILMVRSQTAGGSGNYTLRFARLPGNFIVPSGDEGGALTNGSAHAGVMTMGDLDLWSFSANAGDTIATRVGVGGGPLGFAPEIRMYGPDGNPLDVSLTPSASARDGRSTITTTNTGVHTLVINSCYLGVPVSSVAYTLHFARIPGMFVTPAGDDGGSLTDGASRNGIISVGDQDVWSFAACANRSVSLFYEKLSGGGLFTPRMRLFSPQGSLLSNVVNTSTATITTLTTNNGNYTVIVDGGNINDAGNYRLTASGVASNGLCFCGVFGSGDSLVLNGAGLTSIGTFVLLTSTNITAGAWQPMLTNQLDGFGAFEINQPIAPNDKARYFRLSLQ